MFELNGKLTLKHVLQDSLMPQLPVYCEEKPFREMLKSVMYANETVFNIFGNLSEIFQHAGLPVASTIRKEWNEMKKVTTPCNHRKMAVSLSKVFTGKPRIQFFTWLAATVLNIQYCEITSALLEQSHRDLKVYYLMKYLKTLELYMQGLPKAFLSGDDGFIYNCFRLLLGCFYLALRTTFHQYIKTETLYFFYDEVKEWLEEQHVNDPQCERFRTMINDMLADLIASLQITTSNRKQESGNRHEVLNTLNTGFSSATVEDVMRRQPMSGPGSVDVYLKPKEAAEKLNINRQTLTNYRSKKILKNFRKAGNRYEYSKLEIDTLIASRNHK